MLGSRAILMRGWRRPESEVDLCGGGYNMGGLRRYFRHQGSVHFGVVFISLARPLAPDIVVAIVASIAFAKLDPVYGTASGKRQAISLS